MFLLVTQSFGKESEYRRALLAVTSFWSWYDGPRKEVRTLIYTDNPNWFTPWLNDLPVDYELLTPEKIRNMRGNIDFLHRMKIAILEEAFTKNEGAHILYIDSDTFFMADAKGTLESIASGKAYMHIKEYPFYTMEWAELPAGEPARRWYQAVHSLPTYVDAKEMAFNKQYYSYNAGVLGLPYFFKKYLKGVYYLTDKCYLISGNHATEQYAFSIVLQNTLGVATASHCIYHYWEGVKKRIMDEYLLSVFNKVVSGDELLTKVKRATEKLPLEIKNHYYWISFTALNFFYKKQVSPGIIWSLKAFIKRPLSSGKVIKDALYFIRKSL